MSLRDLKRRLREARREPTAPLRDLRAVVEASRRAAGPSTPDPADLVRLAALAAGDPAFGERLRRLDGDQLAAVVAPDRSLLVQAHVGSGKTRVLVERVVTLNRREGLALADIAVLTFTRMAAGEMRRRLLEATGTTDGLPLVGTFHGVALELLRRAGENVGGVLSDEARTRLARRLIERHGLTIKYQRHVLRRLERLAEGVEVHGSMRAPDDIARLGALIREHKEQRGLHDFADLLERARASLLGGAVVRPAAVVVDELQDSDAGQLDFLQAMVGDAPFFAVGDPHQVVYTWRGSRPEAFDTVRRGFGCRQVRLRTNYRSTERILEAARGLLTPGEADVVGKREGGAPVRVSAFADPAEEAREVTARIAEALEGEVDPSEVAILFRTRDRVPALRVALTKAGIPFETTGERGVAARPAVEWVRAALRAVIDPSELRLKSLMADRRYGELKRSRWNALARGSGTPVEAVRRLSVDTARDARLAVALGEELLEAGSAVERGGDAEGVFGALNLARRLRPTASTYEEDVAAVRSELARWLAGSPGPDSLRERLDASAPVPEDDLVGPTDESARGAVRLLTFHGCKGLEFRRVFVVGANDGITPLARGRRGEGWAAEERRLFYVAMTRAADRLEISWVRQPDVTWAQPQPSIYVDLIPLHVEAKPAVEPPATADPFAVGTGVVHARYGQGVVKSADEARVVCTFGPHGDKPFARAFCAAQLRVES